MRSSILKLALTAQLDSFVAGLEPSDAFALRAFADTFETVCHTRSLEDSEGLPLYIDDLTQYSSDPLSTVEILKLISLPSFAYYKCSARAGSLSLLRDSGEVFVAETLIIDRFGNELIEGDRAEFTLRSFNHFGVRESELHCLGSDLGTVRRRVETAYLIKQHHALSTIHLYEIGGLYRYLMSSCVTESDRQRIAGIFERYVIQLLTPTSIQTRLHEYVAVSADSPLLNGFSTKQMNNWFEDIGRMSSRRQAILASPRGWSKNSLRILLALDLLSVTFPNIETHLTRFDIRLGISADTSAVSSVDVPALKFPAPLFRLATVNDGKLAKDGAVVKNLAAWLTHSKVEVAVISEGTTWTKFDRVPVVCDGMQATMDEASQSLESTGTVYQFCSPEKVGRALAGGVALIWTGNDGPVPFETSQLRNQYSISHLIYKGVRIVGLYLRPGDGSDDYMIRALFPVFRRLAILTDGVPSLVTGDMNSVSGSMRRLVLDAGFEALNLTLRNRGLKTYHADGKEGKDLDLLFASEELKIRSTRTAPKVRTNDHDRVVSEIVLVQKGEQDHSAEFMPWIRRQWLSLLGLERPLTGLRARTQFAFEHGDDTQNLPWLGESEESARISCAYSNDLGRAITHNDLREAIEQVFECPSCHGVSKVIFNDKTKLARVIRKGLAGAVSHSLVADPQTRPFVEVILTGFMLPIFKAKYGELPVFGLSGLDDSLRSAALLRLIGESNKQGLFIFGINLTDRIKQVKGVRTILESLFNSDLARVASIYFEAPRAKDTNSVFSRMIQLCVLASVLPKVGGPGHRMIYETVETAPEVTQMEDDTGKRARKSVQKEKAFTEMLLNAVIWPEGFVVLAPNLESMHLKFSAVRTWMREVGMGAILRGEVAHINYPFQLETTLTLDSGEEVPTGLKLSLCHGLELTSIKSNLIQSTAVSSDLISSWFKHRMHLIERPAHLTVAEYQRQLSMATQTWLVQSVMNGLVVTTGDYTEFNKAWYQIASHLIEHAAGIESEDGMLEVDVIRTLGMDLHPSFYGVSKWASFMHYLTSGSRDIWSAVFRKYFKTIGDSKWLNDIQKQILDPFSDIKGLFALDNFAGESVNDWVKKMQIVYLCKAREIYGKELIRTSDGLAIPENTGMEEDESFSSFKTKRQGNLFSKKAFSDATCAPPPPPKRKPAKTTATKLSTEPESVPAIRKPRNYIRRKSPQLPTEEPIPQKRKRESEPEESLSSKQQRDDTTDQVSDDQRLVESPSPLRELPWTLYSIIKRTFSGFNSRN